MVANPQVLCKLIRKWYTEGNKRIPHYFSCCIHLCEHCSISCNSTGVFLKAFLSFYSHNQAHLQKCVFLSSVEITPALFRDAICLCSYSVACMQPRTSPELHMPVSTELGRGWHGCSDQSGSTLGHLLFVLLAPIDVPLHTAGTVCTKGGKNFQLTSMLHQTKPLRCWCQSVRTNLSAMFISQEINTCLVNAFPTSKSFNPLTQPKTIWSP